MTLVPGAAVVTGASRGIGAACAIALAREGAAVAVGYCAAAEAAAAVVEQIQAEGGRALAVRADVAEPGEVARLADVAREDLGEVSVVVSNAGALLEFKPLAELTWDDYQQHVDVTLKGLFLLAQAFLPGMLERGRGRLIGVGSTSVDGPVPGLHPYTTAKAAQIGMLRSLAKEMGPQGVTVNLVVPGYSATDRVALLSEQFTAAYARRNPVGRLGLPEDVAAAVCHLASEEAQYVTGAELLLDGGHALT